MKGNKKESENTHRLAYSSIIIKFTKSRKYFSVFLGQVDVQELFTKEIDKAAHEIFSLYCLRG